jgi:hypothetical protein
MSGTLSVRGIGFREGNGRELSMLSHHDALCVTCRILFRRDGALNPSVAHSFSALFSITVVPRFNTSAFCVPGSPIFGGSTLGGNQWDPDCDALGFQPDLLTLMNRSTALTLVNRRSTWVITLKTSPTTPKDTPWSTHGQGWVKTLVKPLEHPLTPQCQPEHLPRSPNFT